LGGKRGGKIVKRRPRGVVAASDGFVLWSHLAGQVVASPGGARGCGWAGRLARPACIARGGVSKLAARTDCTSPRKIFARDMISG
jgi:hypothetical protein